MSGNVKSNTICLCAYTHEPNPVVRLPSSMAWNSSDPVVAYKNNAILIGRPVICDVCKLPKIALGSREKPISTNYPSDGTCPYCGANDWGIDCGITVCDRCGNYD